MTLMFMFMFMYMYMIMYMILLLIQVDHLIPVETSESSNSRPDEPPRIRMDWLAREGIFFLYSIDKATK